MIFWLQPLMYLRETKPIIIMKKTIYYLFAVALSSAVLMSCGDDEDPEPETVIETVDSSQPMGETSTTKMGVLVEENDTGTKGTAKIIKDADGIYFLELGSDFETNLGTGTVSVFLAKSAVFKTGMPDGSQMAVGTIAKNGLTYFKLSSAPDAAFTHVILWCSTAGIPFGNAELK